MFHRSLAIRIAAGSMLCIACLQNNTTAQQIDSGQPVQSAMTATDRLYVDLPGSYGGRLYFDEPAAAAMMKHRVLVDSVRTGGRMFRREYWAVYAGMGMWEGVINCYAQEGGRYHIVSMVQPMQAGKPGEEAGGKPQSPDELKAKVVSALRDTTNAAVARFTTMLNTVQINK